MFYIHTSASPVRRLLLLAMVIMLAAGSVALARPVLTRVTALLEYGYAWICAGSLPMAYTQFREAATQDSTNVESRLVMGIIDHLNGDDRKALDNWSEAEKLGNTDAAALAGDLYFTNGRLAEAETAYQRVLKANPSSVKALYGLALVAEKKGHDDEAIEKLTKVVESFGEDPSYELPQVYYHLGKLQIAAGDPAGALKALQRGALLAPRDAYMSLALGQAYEAKGSIPEAVHAYEHALQLSPHLAPAEEGLRRLATLQSSKP